MRTFEPLNYGVPAQQSKLAQIVGSPQILSYLPQNVPHGLVPKHRDVIPPQKDIFDHSEDGLSEFHFDNKFKQAIVIQDLNKKVRNRVNKIVPEDVFHGLVQNRSILK